MFRLTKSVLLLSVLLCLISQHIYAQLPTDNKKLYNSAERFEAISDYEKALPYYQKLVENNPDNANYNFKYGACLVDANAPISAIPYLEKACASIDKNYRSNYKQTNAPYIALLYMGKEYHTNYRFKEALAAYSQYEQFVPNSDKKELERISMLKNYCKSGIELMKNPKNVKHLDFSEAESVFEFAHSPIFSPDGSIYVFTTDKSPGGKIVVEEGHAYNENIYYTYFSDGTWIAPKLLSENITSSKNEASVSLHPNGKQLIIYQDDNDDGNLYYSDLVGKNLWSKPKKFPYPINTTYQESHATLSADGNTIYFTSDRPGGYGGLDIYVCHKNENGKWGEAMNMGPQINTPYHEEGPHLQVDGNVLYFSSDRPQSLGGFDVFYCKVDGDSILTDAKNIGYPINTPYNDLFFKTTADGSTGYFSTSCRTSKGELDLNIVQFLDIPRKPNVKVRGLVLNESLDTLYDLHVNLFDIAKRDIVDSTVNTIDNKYYEFDVFSERKYFASFEYDGYVYFSTPFEVEKYFARLSFSNVIELEPIVLTESTMRQMNSDFVFTSRLIHDKSDFKDSLSRYDVISQVGQQKTQNLNVDETRLAMSVDSSVIRRRDSLLLAMNNTDMQENFQLDDDSLVFAIDDYTLKEYQLRDEKETSLISSITNDLIAQKKAIADSIKQIGVYNFQQEYYEQSITNFYNAIDVYAQIDNKIEQIDCYNRIAEAYLAMGDVYNAIKIYEQTLNLIDDNNLKAKGSQLYAIGQVYDDMFLKLKALEYFEKSKDVRHDDRDVEAELQSIERIGDVYYKHSEYRNAIHQYDVAIILAEKENLEPKTAQYYNKKGLSEQALLHYGDAIDNFNRALDIAEKYKDRKSESIYLNNIANVEYDQKNYQDAIEHYNESIKIKREIDYQDGLAMSLHNLANSHRKLSEYETSIKYYNESLDLSSQNDMFELQAYNHFGLSQSYAATEIYDKALFHYRQYIDFRCPHLARYMNLQASQEIAKYEVGSEELLMLEKKIRDEELSAQFEARRHESKLLELEQTKKKQETLIMSLIILGAGIFMIVILLIMAFRDKKKNHEKLALAHAEISQKNEEILAQHENLEQINVELEKLSIVAEKTANAVAIIDKNQKFEWLNNAFCNLFNGSAGVKIDNGDSIYAIANSPKIKDLIDSCFSYQSGVAFEYAVELASGECVWLQTSLTPIITDSSIDKLILVESDISSAKDAELKIINQRDMIEIQRDEIQSQRDIAVQQRDEIELQRNQIEKAIDDLNRTQRKLVESEKMASLGNLVAGVAHEINTPVGIGIAASSSLITKTNNINEMFHNKTMKQSDLLNYLTTAKDSAHLIQTNLQRTGDLVKSFKRVSVDEVTEQKREFDLCDYIKEVILSLAPKIRERNAKIEIVCDDKIVINSYPGLFAQIITNMVVNSITHAYKEKTDGIITISLKLDNENVHFVYSDDGSGMTPEVRQKVFDPFFTTNMQGGTGLGMNIIYNIVSQKLGGDIVCESELGKGTSFIIDFPA